MIIDPEVMNKVITHGIEAYPAIIHAQMKAHIITSLVDGAIIFGILGGVILLTAACRN